jgi:hypothetical protein
VLEAEVFRVEVSALGQPGFEMAGGFDYVHAGNDSGVGGGSQYRATRSTQRTQRDTG